MEEGEAVEKVRAGLLGVGRSPRVVAVAKEKEPDGWLETWLKGGEMLEYVEKFKEQDVREPGDLKGVGLTNVGRIFGVEKYAHVVRLGRMIERLEVEEREGEEEKKQ